MANEQQTTPAPLDSGTAKYDVFAVRGGKTGADHPLYPAGITFYHTIGEIAEQRALANPEEAARVTAAWLNEQGIGAQERHRRQALPDRFRTMEAVGDLIVETNNNLPASERPEGWQRVTFTVGKDCNGKKVNVAVIHPGQSLVMPEGKEFTAEEHYECPPEARKPPPTPTVPLEIVPETPPTEVVERKMQERLRHSTEAADGEFVTPYNLHHGYQTRALSNVDPDFSNRWYKLEDNAARLAGLLARDTGQRSDFFQNEGPHLAGESDASHGDDWRHDKNSNGRKRQVGFVAGYMALTVIEKDGQQLLLNNANGETLPLSALGPDAAALELPTGTMIRYNRAIFETAHRNLPDSGDVVGILLDPPRGFLTTKPSSQMPFDAVTNAGGSTQQTLVLSWEDFNGRLTFFHDTQAQTSDALEAINRVNEETVLMNSQNSLFKHLAAMEATTDANELQRLGREVQIDMRDYRQNPLIVRVDSLQSDIAKDQAAVDHYLETKGVNVAASKADLGDLSKAPRRDLVFMEKSTKDGLQDSTDHGGNNPQHLGIGKAGDVIPGSRALVNGVFQNQTYAESRIAAGYTEEREATAIASDAQKAWAMVIPSDGAMKAIGTGIRSNYELALGLGEGLADMPHNPGLYGFKNRKEALAFVSQFTSSEAGLRELTNSGSTSWMMDDPNNMQRGALFGEEAGKAIEQNPALLREAITRMTGPKTDGRYARDLGRALVMENVDTPDALGATYTAVEAALGSDVDKGFIRQTFVNSATYAEKFITGRSVVGVNWLDAQVLAADTADRIKAGEKVEMVTDATVEARRAALRASGQGGKVELINTGNFDVSAVFEAARAGDHKTEYYNLALSSTAQANNGSEIVTKILNVNGDLARDVLLVAVLQTPDAFDGPIKELRKLQKSAQGSDVQRYGEMASALSDAQNAAEMYAKTGGAQYRDKAALRMGDFHKDMQFNATNNFGASRSNAAITAINLIADNDKSANAVLEAGGSDEVVRDAILVNLKKGLRYTDNTRTTNVGKSGEGNQLASTMMGDDSYQARYYTTPTEEGKKRGWFGGIFQKVTVNSDLLATAVAGSPDSPTSGKPADATATLAAAGTPADATPAAGTPGGTTTATTATPGTPSGTSAGTSGAATSATAAIAAVAPGTPPGNPADATATAGTPGAPAGTTPAEVAAAAAPLLNSGVSYSTPSTLTSGIDLSGLHVVSTAVTSPGATTSSTLVTEVAAAVSPVDRRIALLYQDPDKKDPPIIVDDLDGCTPLPTPGRPTCDDDYTPGH